MTHSKGGVAHHWLDEALTEKLTTILDGFDPEEAGFVIYEDEQDTVDCLVQNAPKKLTYYDISEHYIGEDKKENEERLMQLFKRAYDGYDILGTAIQIGEAVAPGQVMNGTEKNTRMVRAINAAVTKVLVPTIKEAVERNFSPVAMAKQLTEFAHQLDNATERLIYTQCASMFSAKEDITV